MFMKPKRGAGWGESQVILDLIGGNHVHVFLEISPHVPVSEFVKVATGCAVHGRFSRNFQEFNRFQNSQS